MATNGVVVQVLGFVPPLGETQMELWLLASAWPSNVWGRNQ